MDGALYLPGFAESIAFTAEVIWSRPASKKTLGSEVGVKFVAIDPTDQTRIKQYANLTAMPPS